MQNQIELIKNLRKELDELQSTLSTFNTNYDNIGTEINDVSNYIKSLDENTSKLELLQIKVLFKLLIIPFLTIVLACYFSEIIAKILLITMLCGTFASIFPATSKFVYNFLLKLSPNFKRIDNELKSIKKKKIEKLEYKKRLDSEKMEAFAKIVDIKNVIENMEIQLKQFENIYFNNLFSNNDNKNISTTPKTNVVRIRRK